MKKCLLIVSVAILVLFLQGCTFSYYRLRDEISSAPVDQKFSGCSFEYSLHVIHYGRFVSMGNRPYPVNKKTIANLRRLTERVLTEKGCTAKFVKNPHDANLKIEVVISPFLSALPQEWLSGLSLGLIPSWGTKEGEFRFSFEDAKSNETRTYYVDKPLFNHVIVVPVFWLGFFFPDPAELYGRALSDFVEHPRPAKNFAGKQRS